MRGTLIRIAMGATIAGFLTAGTASAQSAAKAPRGEPKWTLEVHGGGALGSTPSGGTTSDFPRGSTFTTELGFPSRANPSWYYGDGAVLFNEVNAQFASQFNQRFSTIVPLDPVLTSAALQRGGGFGFGARIGRRLSRRLGLEFSIDRAQGHVELTGGAAQGIEATRASFESAFRGLIGTIPQAGLNVTSTADLPDATDFTQTSFTAALVVSLTSGGRLGTYAVMGGGTVMNDVSDVNVRLRGSYQFRFVDTFPINETDVVDVRFIAREDSFIGVVGGGLTYDLGRRHGVRVDARAHIGKGGHSTAVSATPISVAATQRIALPSRTNPSLQFSTILGTPSSLSGSSSRLETFSGDSLDVRALVTVGFYWRF